MYVRMCLLVQSVSVSLTSCPASWLVSVFHSILLGGGVAEYTTQVV